MTTNKTVAQEIEERAQRWRGRPLEDEAHDLLALVPHSGLTRSAIEAHARFDKDYHEQLCRDLLR